MPIEKKDIGVPATKIRLGEVGTFELEDSNETEFVQLIVETNLFDENVVRIPLVVPARVLWQLYLEIEKEFGYSAQTLERPPES